MPQAALLTLVQVGGWGLLVWVCSLQQGGDVMFNAKLVSADNVQEVGTVFEGDLPSLECEGIQTGNVYKSWG